MNIVGSFGLRVIESCLDHAASKNVLHGCAEKAIFQQV